MIRFLTISVCLMMLAGCNQSPEQKIGKAQEKVIDAKAEAQEQQQEVAQDVNVKQKDLNQATNEAVQDLREKQMDLNEAKNEADRTVQENQENVQEARENLVEMKIEVANDKVDAQAKLNTKLQNLEERAGKLEQLPAKTDSIERSKFAETMALVNTNLVDARGKVSDFAQVSATEWQGPYETASNALAKLEDSIQKAE